MNYALWAAGKDQSLYYIIPEPRVVFPTYS